MKTKYETSILAREVNYNVSSDKGWYIHNNEPIELWVFGEEENFIAYSVEQESLQKWLREEHEIYVTILPWKDYNVSDNDEDYKNKEYKFRPMIIGNKTFGQYDTWEEALEIGLQEGLKLIDHD